MSNRVHLTLANRAWGLASFEPLAKCYVYETNTTTQVSIYADQALLTPLSQPQIADAYGNFVLPYVASAALVTVLVTNAAGVALPGYPINDIPTAATTATGATAVQFSPTATLPFDNVQDAIVGAAALAGEPTELLARQTIPWTTGGTGNAYTITPSPVITAYDEGQEFSVLASRASTGNTTLNVNGLGVRDWQYRSRGGDFNAIPTGGLQADRTYRVRYDGVRFLTEPNEVTLQLAPTATTTTITDPVSGMRRLTLTDITLAYLSADRLFYDWTFSDAFAAEPEITIELPGGTSAYTGMTLGDLAPSTVLSRTTTSVRLVANRVTGAAVFIAGDNITTVRATAYGRYFIA